MADQVEKILAPIEALTFQPLKVERLSSPSSESTPMNEKMNDPVNRPKHYTSHPSGIECIQITEHMNFLLGNVIKYCWRAGLKGSDIQDLEKALFYLKREIARRYEFGAHIHTSDGAKPFSDADEDNPTLPFMTSGGTDEAGL
jgi:hypothetical protein